MSTLLQLSDLHLLADPDALYRGLRPGHAMATALHNRAAPAPGPSLTPLPRYLVPDTSRQGLAGQALPGQPAHDDRLAHGQGAEAGEVGLQPPGQGAGAADDAVAGPGDGAGGEEGGGHGPQTAMGAGIAGWAL